MTFMGQRLAQPGSKERADDLQGLQLGVHHSATLTTLCGTTCNKLTWTFRKWVLPGWPTSKWSWFNMSSSLADLRCWEDASDIHPHNLSRCANLAMQNSRSARPKSSKWRDHFLHVDYVIRVACKFCARVLLLFWRGSEDSYDNWGREMSWKAPSWTPLGIWSVECC